MANRPNDFDITTPRGSSSPRSGDDELRKIKEYSQNAYNDLTQESGAAVTHGPLYGTTVTADSEFLGNLTGNSTGSHTGASAGVHTGDVNGSDNTTMVDASDNSMAATGGFTGALTGNADTATTWETSRMVSLTGDIVGSVAGVDGSADVSVTTSITDNSVDLGTHTTGDYVQGIAGTTNEVTVSGSGGEGSDVVISLPDNITVDVTGNADTATAWETGRSLTLSGDVTGAASGVDGTGNIAITTTIAANSVGLGTDTTGNYVATIAGTADEIVVSGSGSETSAVTLSLPGTINADTTGNAGTATAWATSRSVALTGDVTGTATGVDGSGNVSIATTVANNSVDLGTHTTGNYVATIAGTINEITVSGSGSETSAVTLSLPDTINADTTGTAATSEGIETVTRATDADHYLTFVTDDNSSATSETLYTNSGIKVNPSTGNIEADLAGNATTATGLETARTFTFQKADAATAGITGAVTFDGTGNVTIDTTLQGSVTEGSVESAAKWTTPRNFTFTGDVTSPSNSVDGSTNESFVMTIANNVVGADELNVSGDGSSGQFLASDGDGTMTWTTQTDTNTTYTGGTGISLSGTTFNVDNPFTDADETKLDGIETSADVTDTTNVVAALTAGTNITISADGTVASTNTNTTYSGGTGISLSGTTFNVDNPFTDADETKLDGIEASADVTDTANVVSALTAGTNVAISAGGTVSSTNTTYTAGTALSLSGTSFSVTNNGVTADQLNVSGDGTVTQFLRSDGDGSMTWATPVNTNTTYSAGTALSLSGTSFSVTANGITADQLNVSGDGTSTQFLRSDGDGSMTWATPANTTYSNFTGQTASGGYLIPQRDSGNTTTKFMREDGDWVVPTDTNTTYTASTGLTLSGTALSITSGGVGATQLASDAVTNAKIGSLAVDTAELANDAVNAAKIEDNAVGAAALNVSGNGSAGQVLTSDGDGSMTWAASEQFPYFGAAPTWVAVASSTSAFTVPSTATNGIYVVGRMSGFGGSENFNSTSLALSSAGTASWLSHAESGLVLNDESGSVSVRSNAQGFAGFTGFLSAGSVLTFSASGNGTSGTFGLDYIVL